MSKVGNDGNKTFVTGLVSAWMFFACGISGIGFLSVFFGVSEPTRVIINIASKTGTAVEMFSLVLGGVLILVSALNGYFLFSTARGRI